jgi:hypothetical protein
MFRTYVFMWTWVLSECVVGVNSRLFILMNEIYFEFWFFYVNIDVMRVYIVGADGHVSSY